MIKRKKLVIYDDSYFKHVTINNITEEKSIILHDTFTDICKNPKNYAISVNSLQDLIESDKLTIETLATMYENVSHRDKIICLALTKSKEFDVTVYTKDDFLALDLLLNNITVKNVEFDDYFVNIGKSEEKEDIIVYDTCSLFDCFHLIDFSKNIHYFPVCVLEELVGIVSDNDPFFKFLYLYNKYPQNVRILNTVSSTQRGGRYSYTDLLILYSAIRLQNTLASNKKLTLLTKDRTLVFEAMNLNVFNVRRKFDYFNAETTQTITEETATDAPEESIEDVILKVVKDAAKGFYEESDENIDKEDSTDNTTCKNTYLDDITKSITNNYTSLPLRKFNRKNILDQENIIEQVYTANFKIVAPINNRKLDRTFGDRCYEIHPGYWVTFKTNPKTSYKITGKPQNLIVQLIR